MNLEYSDLQSGFYESVLEFVTFDLIPTEELYDLIFGVENEPFSESAENIGYESRYIVQNSGSVSLYISAYGIGIATLTMVRRCASKNGRVYSCSNSRINGVKWSGFTNFLNEIYLPMSYIVCINFSALDRGSVSLFFLSSFATLMSLVLIYWPIYVAIMTYKILK